MAAVEVIRAIITAVDNFSRPMQRIALAAQGPALAFARVGQAAGGVATQVSGLLGPLSAIGGAISAWGLRAATMAFSSFGSDIHDAAQRLQISARALQELRYAGNLAGLSNEVLEGGLKKLNKTLFDVVKGGAPEAREALRQFGISVLDSNGRMRSSADVMSDLIKAFDRIENGGVRSAVAYAMFGKSSADMLPLLTQGSEEFNKLTAEAARFGLVLGDDQIAAADEFGDLIEKLGKVVRGFMLELGSRVAPVLTPLIEKLIEWTVVNRELITSRITDFVAGFADALGKVQWDQIFTALSNTIEALSVFSGWLGPTGTLLAGLGLMFAPLVLSVGNLALALGGAALALGQWVIGMTIGPVIGAFIAALKAGTGIVFAFNWALAANPIGLVVAGIGALIAAGVALYANWDRVVSFLSDSWAMIRKGIAEVIGFVVGAYGKAAELVPDWAGGKELRGKFETVRRDLRDWGDGGIADRPLSAAAAHDGAGLADQAAPGQRVDGKIVLEIPNAPPGTKVERIEGGAGGIDFGVDLGHQPVFIGA